MSYRWLFILSIVVTAVGFVGIFLQLQQPDETKEGNQITILAEVAIKDLKPNDLLTDQDYTLQYIDTNKSDNDKRDISKINNENIAGFRLKEQIAKGDHFTMAVLEQPVSRIVAGHHQLPSGVLYHFSISKKDEYLLTSVTNGDTLSIYIKLTEVRRQNHTALNNEDSDSHGVNENKDQVIYRLFKNVPVVNIERRPSKEMAGADNDNLLGSVALKLTIAQLAEIKLT
ncbi:hypothetical protein JZM24_17505 [Candidatus Sodalis endolongispinus]|uniref:SAF domain-containing protein n=1 Tax=Candidatus Sodalis endolongispinus TaxID=2812662 RepID=A0ABS5YGE3_9GAMM|nr:SAF domain-containing protein [Candidatus Sodalis endolongispinus]MBT9433439.1 hypothetical protein [Candidatus Sodalis endolongispinus]